jgi:ribosome-associated heat shock protein Hsp15
LRLDLFLKTARLFKRRTEAQRQIASGCVLLNGTPAKSARAIAPGDHLVIQHPRVELELEVVKTPAGHVPKAAAPELYRVIRRTLKEDL